MVLPEAAASTDTSTFGDAMPAILIASPRDP